jgi:hypothetical protein
MLGSDLVGPLGLGFFSFREPSDARSLRAVARSHLFKTLAARLYSPESGR